MADTHLTEADLPRRPGPRPCSTENPPHSQIDQQPVALLNEALVQRASRFGDVVVDGSRRSPPGTTGLYLPAAAARNDPRAFLIDREFAHVHPDDGSLHLILPEPLPALRSRLAGPSGTPWLASPPRRPTP